MVDYIIKLKKIILSYWLYFIPHHLVSRFTYIITRTHHPLTHYLIKLYIKMFKINISECEEENIEKYNTFCDFFTRKLKKGIHVVDKNNKSVVSSCDGRILQFGKIEDKSILQVKGIKTSIQSLLCNDKELSSIYSKGSFLTIYLSPKDYHRVHSPANGKLMKTLHVPGRLFSVADHAVECIKDLYAKNERLVCHFKDDSINFSVIFVGAINVSSIETQWKGEVSPPMPKKLISTKYGNKNIVINKGDEVGMFKSGSTVVLLFTENVKLSDKIKVNQAIRVGQKIGMIH
ncbi:MAG: archaetidylserine decarboxylase [Gammaproteobacteria bacterium]